jgi:hypothetical protein
VADFDPLHAEGLSGAGVPRPRRGSDADERLVEEIAKLGETLQSLRTLVIIGGAILIVLMIVGVILEIDMVHLVTDIHSAGV